jgi:hypothetical protein
MDANRWRVIARNQVKHQVEAVKAELHSIQHRLAEIHLRRRCPNAADRTLVQQLFRARAISGAQSCRPPGARAMRPKPTASSCKI